MSPEVLAAIAALLTAAGGIYATWANRKLRQEEARRKQAELVIEHTKREVKSQQQALGLPHNLLFLRKWNLFEQKLTALLESTEVDRFILFRCWNGEDDPQWTTAIYQYREGEQEWYNYILVPLDKDYVERLNAMKVEGVHEIEVSSIPESLIKNVYEAENVNHSMWFHVRSEKPTALGSVAHTYFSAATHTQDKITDKTKARLQDIAWDLANMLEPSKP